jgi:hypothetical protein
MSTRQRLLHDWTRQVGALLPGVRATRARTLAWLLLGLAWAGNVALLKVAAALPVAAKDASTERRLRRWLANPAVVVAELWGALLPALLAGRAGQEVLLVLDPTPPNGAFTVLVLGLVCRKRVLPVAWRVVPQQAAWERRQIAYLRELFAEVGAALPPGCEVTVVGDRGLAGAELIDACREAGFHPLFRLSADARQGCLARVDGGPERPVWGLVTGAGQRWEGAVEVFKQAGWRALQLTIRWEPGQAEPWLLLSDRPAGGARVREYRRRAHAEATYADGKRRGWDLEASKLAAPDRFDRLLLGLHLAYWWATQNGLRAIRRGARDRYDRADRRDLSVVRIGRAWLAERLEQAPRRPPLPFRATAPSPSPKSGGGETRPGRTRASFLAASG